MEIAELDYNELVGLYDRSRYLEAWECTREWWQDATILEQMTVEQLVFAGRLGNRLGGQRLSRRLFRQAYLREPEHPVVRLYCRDCGRKKYKFIDDLEYLARHPGLDSGNPDWDSSWRAGQAMLWARVRDSDRAWDQLARARKETSRTEWIDCCESWAHFYLDRWDRAYELAAGLIATGHRFPALVSIYGRALVKLGRLDEACREAQRLADEAPCWENCGMSLWTMSIRAERMGGNEKRAIASAMDTRCEQLDTFAPLACRETKQRYRHIQMWAAMLAGDYEKMTRYSREIAHPFYRKVAANLKENQQGQQKIVSYRPVYQEHLTCLPCSIAAVLGRFGHELDEKELARAMTYDGTPTWLAVNWLREKGYATKSFIVRAGLARQLLDAGLPFVIMIQYIGSAHATAMIGYDDRCGFFISHDPSQERWDLILQDMLDEIDGPFGPEGLAIVPADQAALLDLIPEEDSAPITATNAYRLLRETQGACSCQDIIDKLTADYGRLPMARRLQAYHQGQLGNLYGAIQQEEVLLTEYPDSISVRNELLFHLRLTRDSARMREVMAEIVEQGRIPGAQEAQQWLYPPGFYVMEYAELLGYSHEGRDQAIRMLRDTLNREITNSGLYHALGDMYIWQGQEARSELFLRLACNLEPTNDHYARALADALRSANRQQEALAFLSDRTEKLGRLVKGAGAWITWIDALMDYGYPEEALNVLAQAREVRPDDTRIESFAVRFQAWHGMWEQAETTLEKLRATGDMEPYCEAAVYYYDLKGDWRNALISCRLWMETEPHNMNARREYLTQLRQEQGRKATLSVASQWLADNPHNDTYEEIYLDELNDNFETEGGEALLRDRAARNPLDSWGWEKLGRLLLHRFGLASPDQRESLMDEIQQIEQTLIRLSPHNSRTILFGHQVALAKGDYNQAGKLIEQALAINPEYSACYHAIWDCYDHLPAEKQAGIIAILEENLFKTTGFLWNARTVILNIARRHGVKRAEALIEPWRKRAPQDPALIEANIDLLLHFGQGRQDARRAIEIILPQMKKYPNNFDLKMSLAMAYDILSDDEKQVPVLKQIIQQQPRQARARLELAEVLLRQGQADQAVALMEAGCELNPANERSWLDAGYLYYSMGDYSRALAAAQKGLERIPESIDLRERTIHLLMDLGHHQDAVNLARLGTELAPDGAYLWYLYGETLYQSPSTSDIARIESCFRKALALNASFTPAAMKLASLMVDKRQYKEARQLLNEQAPICDEPEKIYGQLASITRQQGQLDKAVDEMAGLLQKHPCYFQGWDTLIDWITQDKDWKRAKKYFNAIPEVVHGNPVLCARRLHILAQAGVETGRLDREWQQLLINFPENEAVHLIRFDILLERKDTDKASEVITAIERIYPRSAFVLARKVQLYARWGQWDTAIEAAQQVWQLPGDDEVWPEQTVWESLREVHQRAVEAALVLLRQRIRIRKPAFDMMLDMIQMGEAAWQRHPWGRKLWRSKGVRMRMELMNILETCPWDNGTYLASVMQSLSGDLCEKHVLRYWARHQQRCYERTPVWQQIGYALAKRGPKSVKVLRKWMTNWRERNDVEMWALVQYINSLRQDSNRHRQTAEIYQTAHDTLARIAPDYTMKYLVCVLCEGALRLGHDQEFLETYLQYESLINDDSDRFWIPGSYIQIPPLLRHFKYLIETGELDYYHIKLGHKAVMKCFVNKYTKWAILEWKTRLKQCVPFWRRFLMHF